MPKLRALSAFWNVDDRLRAGDDDALDRLVEVLVEDAGGDDAAAAAEHLPAAVDVLDQRALQVRDCRVTARLPTTSVNSNSASSRNSGRLTVVL